MTPKRASSIRWGGTACLLPARLLLAAQEHQLNDSVATIITKKCPARRLGKKVNRNGLAAASAIVPTFSNPTRWPIYVSGLRPSTLLPLAR
jgi:hypothetical protein